jgi:excisionase family DNA binding protein
MKKLDPEPGASAHLAADTLAYGIMGAAKAAGVSRSMIYREIKERRLRTVKLGSRTLIRRADMIAWLDNLSAA